MMINVTILEIHHSSVSSLAQVKFFKAKLRLPCQSGICGILPKWCIESKTVVAWEMTITFLAFNSNVDIGSRLTYLCIHW